MMKTALSVVLTTNQRLHLRDVVAIEGGGGGGKECSWGRVEKRRNAFNIFPRTVFQVIATAIGKMREEQPTCHHLRNALIGSMNSLSASLWCPR